MTLADCRRRVHSYGGSLALLTSLLAADGEAMLRAMSAPQRLRPRLARLERSF